MIGQLSWIIQVDPKYHYQCFFEREGEGEGDHTHRKGGGNATAGAETGGVWPQVKKFWQQAEAKRGEGQILS